MRDFGQNTKPLGFPWLAVLFGDEVEESMENVNLPAYTLVTFEDYNDGNPITPLVLRDWSVSHVNKERASQGLDVLDNASLQGAQDLLEKAQSGEITFAQLAQEYASGARDSSAPQTADYIERRIRGGTFNPPNTVNVPVNVNSNTGLFTPSPEDSERIFGRLPNWVVYSSAALSLIGIGVIIARNK